MAEFEEKAGILNNFFKENYSSKKFSINWSNSPISSKECVVSFVYYNSNSLADHFGECMLAYEEFGKTIPAGTTWKELLSLMYKEYSHVEGISNIEEEEEEEDK